MFVPVPSLSSSPSLFVVFVTVSRFSVLLLSTFLSTFAMSLCLYPNCRLVRLYLLSVSVPKLFAYIFSNFYYKSKPKYEPKAITLSKELINVALCPLSWLLYLLHHPLYSPPLQRLN